MLLSCLLLALPGWSLAATRDPHPGIIDLGIRHCYEALSICPRGYELPVIRAMEELSRIQAHIGNTSKISSSSSVYFSIGI